MYDEWKQIYTALAADSMDSLDHRNHSMAHDIRPSQRGTAFAGPAVTLDAYESTEQVDDPYAKLFDLYKVLEPGAVIVIATNGEVKSGLWGELLATAAAARGVTSMVTDGLVRDIRLMDEMGCGTFSRGYSTLDTAGRCMLRDVNKTVSCGGVKVNPGDLILADYEGVVAIPAAIQEEVLRLALEKLAGEGTVRDELAAGASPREVFDKYGIL